MSNYFLFGKYENGSSRNASADRTNLCKEITTKYGGKFISCYALLGEWDIVCQAEFPNNEEWTTCPAVDITTYDNFTHEVWNEESVPTYYNVN